MLKKKYFFLGRKFNIKIYNLHKYLDIIYAEIKIILKKNKDKSLIFTHAWEGGNEDHDSCHVIVKKIFFNDPKIIKCYQFSQYRAIDGGYERGENKEQTFTTQTNYLINNGFVMIDIFLPYCRALFLNKHFKLDN